MKQEIEKKKTEQPLKLLTGMREILLAINDQMVRTEGQPG